MKLVLLKTPTTRLQAANLAIPWKKSAVSNLPHGKATRVKILVEDFLRSDRYKSLGLHTKKSYLSALNTFELLVLASNQNIFQMRAHNVDYGIVDYIKHVLGHSHAPATISMYFSMLSGIWDVALRNGKVNFNPWQKARIKLNNERDVTWTPEQIRTGINTAKEMGFHVLALYLLLAYETAQRPWRDLRDLKWENIKLDENGRQFVDFIISKTRTRLLLPLSKEAIKALNEAKVTAYSGLSEYIFIDANCKRYTQSALTEQFKKMKKRAMLDPVLLIRDLRRTAITEMAMAGATTEEITASTGWRCTDSVIRRYSRLRKRTAERGLEKREALRDEQKQLSEVPTVCTEVEITT